MFGAQGIRPAGSTELDDTYTHTESTTKVAQGNPGARISRVIHDGIYKRVKG